MSAEAWIALVALTLSVIVGVIYLGAQFVVMRRDLKEMRKHIKVMRINHLPHILGVLESLPCRQPSDPGENQDCGWEKPQHN